MDVVNVVVNISVNVVNINVVELDGSVLSKTTLSFDRALIYRISVQVR
ncbi:hypothetical protein [Lentzea sp. CA-135723]